MRSKNLFYKPTSIFRKIIFWSVPLFLISLIWFLSRNEKINSNEIWLPPIEPKGTIIVTENTARQPIPDQGLKTSTDTVARESSNAKEFVDAVASLPKKTEEASLPDTKSLETALQNWRRAWSTKDTRTYLDLYAPDFSPPKGMSREAWENMRVERIKSKQRISIDMDELVVQMDGTVATTTFKQIYQDGRLRMTNKKTLKWVQRQQQWKILDEQSD